MTPIAGPFSREDAIRITELYQRYWFQYTTEILSFRVLVEIYNLILEKPTRKELYLRPDYVAQQVQLTLRETPERSGDPEEVAISLVGG
jgi:hypothetical protein